MSSEIIISGDWLRGIQASLAIVETSGAAYAAIQAARDFARDTASAVKEGGSWWSPDPWRTSAAADLENAGTQLSRETTSYAEGSSTPIDRALWSRVAAKVSNLYALAKLTREGFPEGEDSTVFDSSLIEGAALLAEAVLNSPKAAVEYVTGFASDAIGKVGDVAKKTVKEATGVLREFAGGVAAAAGDAVPWRVLLGAGLVLAAAVGGVVLLARSGAIKQIGGLRG